MYFVNSNGNGSGAAMKTGRDNRRGDSGTLALSILAALALAFARHETCSSVAYLAAQTAVAILVPVALLGVMRRSLEWGKWLDRWLPAWVATWVMASGLSDLVARAFGIGDALEIVLLVALQNTSLMLAAFSHRRRARQVAVLFASFLVLFAIVIGNQPRVVAAAVAFGVAALWWMMANYWERIQGGHEASRVASHVPVRVSVWAATLAVIGLVGVIVLTVGGNSTYSVAGFMPTSGGDRWSDPAARAGVGDGDAMVAARDQAMSFGPVESELFIESKMPSLYDIATDMYGTPPKPKTQHDRAIALSGQNVKHPRGRMSRTQRSGREFSTVRRRGEAQQRALENRDAPALFYVIGRVPLHLSLETFDTYDGNEWSQVEDLRGDDTFQVKQFGAPPKPWIEIPTGIPSELQRGVSRHGLKVINLKTARIPSPPQIASVHIDLLDQGNFFGRTRDGQLEMTGRDSIPQLTVMHLLSHDLNLSQLRQHDFRRSIPRDPEAPDQFLYANAPIVAETARRWTAEHSTGWQQVEAIVERLRGEFTHDPEATVPDDGRSAVEHFLTERRGPDYLFATTAAILLRHQGYSTRLVSGFYARDDRHDRRANQTAILPQDIHTWVEVRVAERGWVPIEPTPGFDPPVELRTWGQQLAIWAKGIASWLRQCSIPLGISAISAICLWVTRLRWLEWIGKLVCAIAAGRTSLKRQVHWTLRLLEWRSRLAGAPRPPTATVSRWYGRLAASPCSTDSPFSNTVLTTTNSAARSPGDSLHQATQPASDDALELRQFLRLAERALYAPEAEDRPPDQEERRVFAVVARRFDVRRMRAARPPLALPPR
jgi:transglutaminase-like putative cysteine protease